MHKIKSDNSDTNNSSPENDSQKNNSSFRVPIYGSYTAPAGKIIPYEERITYSWTGLNVFVKIPAMKKQRIASLFKKNDGRVAKTKHIVKNVTGIAYPGQLLAVMGSSGAGKTTLLNALTYRTTTSYTVTGGRYINGVPVIPSTFVTKAVYVQQHDLFIGSLTVREHLIFQALVRMDSYYTYQQRLQRVEEVLQELSLQRCQNTMIGIPGRIKGISGGEMKRLSLASEILTNPGLMFCDEPTSGLDSFMAMNVVQNLKNLAMTGKTIVCTIHQPSSEVYAMFDKILLMSEGRTVFLGCPEEATVFFNEQNYPCPKNFNPADYFVQLLAILPGREEECRSNINNLCDVFEKSGIGVKLIMEANSKGSNELSLSGSHRSFENTSRSYKSSWWKQFQAVLWRSWLSTIKEPLIIRVRIVQTLILGLLIGAIYFNQNLDQNGVMNLNGVMFIFLTNMTFQNCFAVINVFCTELPVFLREHRNGMYRTDVYFISKTLTELPFFTLIPIVFISVTYYMVGLNHDVNRFFISCGLMVLVTHAAVSFGHFISCVSRDIRMALSLGPPLIIPFLLFGGYLLNINSIPIYFRWLSYFSWFRYGAEGLFINQWQQVTNIVCDTNATSLCLHNGHDVLEVYNFEEGHFLEDIIGLFCLTLFYKFLGFIALIMRTYSYAH